MCSNEKNKKNENKVMMEKWIMFLSLLFLTLGGGTVIAVVIPAWIKMIVYLVKELTR